MIFNSLIYLFFLAITATGYYLSPVRFRLNWLLAASIIYYMSFIPVFFVLLAVLVPVNYLLSLLTAKADEKSGKRILITCILINILILAFFKYFDVLFPGNTIHLYRVDFLYSVDPVNKMILPLGLSYIVFTIISYHIEIKRKTINAGKHFGKFFLYIIFFPKISQGPIERPQNLIPQLHGNYPLTYTNIAEGLKLILLGYFKKLVVADRLALYVNAVYNNNDNHNGTSLILATFFFAIQIYADFSGYTDIALGSARLFGIKLTDNFKRPYFATSIKEFWERWHISFSTWLRDYLFLPLAIYLSGRMRKPHYLLLSADKWIYMIATTVTFAICGIWHGVGWTYLSWGLLFGIFLTYSNWTSSFHKRMRKRFRIKKKSVYYKGYKTLTTFVLVLFAWIFFRADTMSDAFSIIGKIFTTAGFPFYDNVSFMAFSVFGILSLFLLDFKHEYFNDRISVLYNKNEFVRLSGIVILILVILLIGVFDSDQFIYFQF